MVKEYYQKICSGEEVRANLIALRNEMKDEKARRMFACLLGGDFTKLCALLHDPDPKVRKNAALILGEMESEDLLPVLFDAYKKEDTLYVRADYLKAISRLEYRPLLRGLKGRLEELRKSDFGKEEQKHISDEIRMLQAMVMKYEKKQAHKFIGYSAKQDLILVTNRCQREATARQIEGGEITMLAGGIRVRGVAVEDVLPIRTYHELLFPIKTAPLYVSDPVGAGTMLASAVYEMAEELHKGIPPFLFRIELKGRIEPDKKGPYIRKISDAMEKASEGRLVNSITDYELEVRLLERKDGTFMPMIKLYTILQKRFAYRKEFVASSIAPVNAALTVELARPYLKEDAQVLDPFCGVGTMLIERQKAVPAKIMYGIDIFGEAVEKARANTERSGVHVYYINKDFFEFEHGYLFDEIITDMPQVTSVKGEEEIRSLYFHFFEKAELHLKDDGVIILYATEPGFVGQAIKRGNTFKITEQYVLNEKNGTTVFIIHRRGYNAQNV